MSSGFPNSIDAFATNHQDDAGEIIHASTVNDLADATNKIETELGTAPSGSFTTVTSRLSRMAFSNTATSSQAASGVDTYLAGSTLSLAGRIAATMVLRWRFYITKTAAGVAAPIYSVRFGAAGTIADTARHTFTGVAQTAATDTAWHELEITVNSIGASAVLIGIMKMDHVNTTTGFATQDKPQMLLSTPAGFDVTGGTLFVGVSVNPGASGVWTYQTVSAVAVSPNAL